MKINMTAMPGAATPQHVNTDPHQATSRLRRSVLLILGFVLTAAALVGIPERPTGTPDENQASVTTAGPEPLALVIDPVIEDPTVTTAVGNWTWEEAATKTSRHSGPYDVHELWLPAAE